MFSTCAFLFIYILFFIFYKGSLQNAVSFTQTQTPFITQCISQYIVLRTSDLHKRHAIQTKCIIQEALCAVHFPLNWNSGYSRVKFLEFYGRESLS